MKQSSRGPAAGADAGLLGHEVVRVASAAPVGEEETPAGRVVKVEAGHVAGADTLVLHLAALV